MHDREKQIPFRCRVDRGGPNNALTPSRRSSVCLMVLHLRLLGDRLRRTKPTVFGFWRGSGLWTRAGEDIF